MIKRISIKRLIIVVFLISMLVSISGIGLLVFTNWFSSARQTTEGIAAEINESIYNNISSFMHVPYHVNEVNHIIIENGTLDLSDQRLRDRFFVGVLSAHAEEIYSFSFGTVDGAYYGARRNENGMIEIMKNDAGTGGNSWYYAVNEDMTAGELVVQAGQFDPRTRAWYKAAAETGSPTFSPVYKHFVMDDLTVSAAWPVYGGDGSLLGVLGTHMLLSGIGDYLETTLRSHNGYAVIVEKKTGELIANSIGVDNFTVLEDGTLKRHTIADIGNTDIQSVYGYYHANGESTFLHHGKNSNFHVNTREIQMDGIDWLVISAIPEGLLIANAVKSIYWTVFLVIIALALSVVIYHIVTRKLLKPISGLLQVSEALSSGELSQRAEVVRNDEIGRISESLNKVADKMQFLINNLEANVNARTDELHRANITLEENKNQLQLILDSTAEAIYGVDPSGCCTFCNPSCIRLLGYGSQEELLGKNMHWQIHHSRRDGTPFPLDECRIIMSMKHGKGYEADDEVFWRADGTAFDVEYHSYPQKRNGKVVGAVITFTDITERKQREERIQYLSCHDTLTGLFNRRCFEDNRLIIDTPDNLPLSVIFADINGLKLTNDIFGHAAGDALIRKSAEILRQSCGEKDVIARIGGDEFVILLPGTDKKNAKKVLTRISSGFVHARVSAIKCSISLGLDTKKSAGQSLEEVMANAENSMYKEKTMNRQAVNRDIIDTLVETLHSMSDTEKHHSVAVSDLCGEAGAAMGLPEPEISKLRRAGYLHDIGKIILAESLLTKETLTAEELEKMRQHSVVGYRILNLFDDTLDLAEYVYSHHENWDGSGYPRGLKGEQIPVISRILSIVETYDRVLNKGTLPPEERKSLAVAIIKEGAGKRFDPEITEVFAQMMGRA